MDRPSTNSVRVLTLNLWGQQGAWAKRRLVLIDGLRALRPDLVAFQETIKDDGYDQVVDLLGTDYHVTHETKGLVRAGEHQGVSIASRWPLGAVDEVNMHLTPRTADFPCTTLVAGIDAPAPLGPLLFVNHFPSWQLAFEYERERQAVAAARFIEDRVARQHRHVVLAGDLDADPAAASIRFWTGRQSLDGISVCYRDAWESSHPEESGHTYTPRNPLMNARDWPFRRIDYILVRCDERGPTLDVAACNRVFDEPVAGVWASDHFGLVADLTVRSGS